MIVHKTNKIPDSEVLRKLKKKVDKIGNKYKTQIDKEIKDYCKKIGLGMLVDIIMDLKLVGKVKERGKWPIQQK